MKNTPSRPTPDITYFHLLPELPEWAFRAGLLEFAANGQRKIVLTDGLMRKMLKNLSYVAFCRTLLAETGMVFCDAHSIYGPTDDLCCLDPDLRRYMLMNHRQTLELAALFGIKTITIHLGRFDNFSIPVQTYRDASLKALDELLPVAEKLGVIICIENSWHQTSSAEALLAAVDHFKSDFLGICYDAGHANVMSGRFRDEANRMWGTYPGREPGWNDHVLEDVLPHVVVCHLHDNDGVRDQHLLPGRGTVEWTKIMPLLKTAPRLQVIQCEAAPGSAPDQMFSIRECVETMNRLVTTNSPR